MNINPVAFTIFGLEVKWYGILIALGVLLAILTTESMAKKKSYKKTKYFKWAYFPMKGGNYETTERTWFYP